MLSVLSTFLAVMLVPAGFLFLWPLTARWMGRNDPLSALTGFGLSIGFLSLWLFALASLGAVSVWPVVAIVALGWGLGAVVNRPWFRFGWLRATWRWLLRTIVQRDLGTLSLGMMLLSLAVVLLHNVYFPFLSDDTLTRYALDARLVYESGMLPREVTGSPLLVSMSFVYTWLVSGGVNEHLAKVVPFAFAAGMLGVTVLLGRRLAGRLNGLLAGAIVAITPLFADWAITGYTDIPAGFYVALATLFALRWVEGGTWRDALLAGAMAGLALWTKQSALTVLASLVSIALLRSIVTRRMRSGLLGLVLLLVPGVLVAGPWYWRNYLIEGPYGVLELPGLYHVAGVKPRLLGLMPALQFPSDFGLPIAGLYALGFLLALQRVFSRSWAALRRHAEWPLPDLTFLAVLLPYWLAWWTRYSFTPRFLLLVLPFYAVWAAWPLTWLAARWSLAARYTSVVAAVGVLLLGYNLRTPLSSLAFAITHPFASDADKLVRVKDDLYPTVDWFEENLKSGERVISMDTRLRYYLPGYEIKVGYPLSFEQIADYDYLVDASGTTGIYQALGWTDSDYWQHRRDPVYFEEVFDGGAGSQVYRVLPPVAEESR